MPTKILEPKRVKIWGNGQITIPLEIRRAYGLTKETIIRIEPESQYISLIPETETDRRGKIIKSAMIKRKLSLADLLDGLEAERETSYNNFLKP